MALQFSFIDKLFPFPSNWFMSEKKNVIRLRPDGNISFYCPGCSRWHTIFTADQQPGFGSRWEWDGDLVSPHIHPSLRIEYGYCIHPKGKAGGSEDGDGLGKIDTSIPTVCHLWIDRGDIQYCDDSTHRLKGKRIAMIPVDEVV